MTKKMRLWPNKPVRMTDDVPITAPAIVNHAQPPFPTNSKALASGVATLIACEGCMPVSTIAMET